MLGVDKEFEGTWAVYNPLVNSQFAKAGDILHPTADYVAALLERGIHVLIYVGTSDWVCNHVGNERWTLAMDWSGRGEFVEAEKREWLVAGKKAGLTRSAKGLTYATVDGAGHMVCRRTLPGDTLADHNQVPYDKPREALIMLQRWIAKEDL
jgi:carboxypeptidase C (cathepsin A)